MEWFRWYHGTVADPKFSIIAKRSKQPRHVVVACWPALLEYASTRDDRGSLCGIDLEEVAVVLDLELEQVESVYKAMIDKGMIEADRIHNWDKRQPIREDETAKERKERWKLKQILKEEQERNGTHVEHNGTHVEHNGTHGTCKTLDQTLDQNREEQTKEKTLNDNDDFVPVATSVPHAVSEVEASSSSKISIFEFRLLFEEATGRLLPGGCNQRAHELCRLYPAKTIKNACEITALQGGQTFKYLEAVLKGKPKPKPEARGRDRPSRQTEAVERGRANVAVAMEAIYAAEGV